MPDRVVVEAEVEPRERPQVDVAWLPAALLVVGAVLAAAVLWFAGEQHRENCLAAERTGCTVLPWDNGRAARPDLRAILSPNARREACRALRYAGHPDPIGC